VSVMVKMEIVHVTQHILMDFGEVQHVQNVNIIFMDHRVNRTVIHCRLVKGMVDVYSYLN